MAADVATRVAARQVLAVLTDPQRAVVVLRLCDDLPEAQVALILGCAVGTVKATMSQALARLRINRTWRTWRTGGRDDPEPAGEVVQGRRRPGAGSAT